MSEPSHKPSRKKVKSPTRIPNAITRVMSWGYGLGIGHVNRKFDRGVGVTKLDVPVISIGNLSAGGTGKTPMVHWVANELIKAGKHPAIAMRGYKAAPGEMGDEEREHRLALPGIPVVAQPDRIAGLEKLFASDEQVDCVILDDGFQHRKIGRDVDIVLIDASSPPYGDALLPRGFLRDPASSLKRADAIVITHREMVNDEQLADLVGWIKREVSDCPVAVTSHRWEAVAVYTNSPKSQGWAVEHADCEHFKGKKIVGMCAIGNPAGFFGQIQAQGWELVEEVELPDHHDLDDDEVGWLCDLANRPRVDALCMTRKDWVKVNIRLAEYTNCPVLVPELGLFFHSGQAEVQGLILEIMG